MKKTMVLQRAKKHFWTTMDVEIFKVSNPFKATDNWKSLSTYGFRKRQHFFQHTRTICHAHVFYIQKSNYMFRRNYFILIPSELHTFPLVEIAKSLIEVACFPNPKCHVLIWFLVFLQQRLPFMALFVLTIKT
jgi:hypothetical protein